MKRIFILAFIAFLTCMTVSAKDGNDEKQITKDLCKTVTKAYMLKSDRVQYDKVTGIGYVFMTGTSLWSHSYEYAVADIMTVMKDYANIQQVGPWSVDPADECVTGEYRCMIDDDRNYTVMFVYYVKSNVISICVYNEK